MNCHRARMALVERDLGALTLGFERALDEHLAACPQCAGDAARDRRLLDGLTALGADDAPAIDLRETILERVAATQAPDRGWVTQAQLRRAAAAAAIAAAALLGVLWWRADGFVSGAFAAAKLVSATASVTYSLLGLAKWLLVLPWRLLSGLAGWAAPWLAALDGLGTLVLPTLGIGLMTMMLAILWIVGNDLMRPARGVWRKQG